MDAGAELNGSNEFPWSNFEPFSVFVGTPLALSIIRKNSEIKHLLVSLGALRTVSDLLAAIEVEDIEEMKSCIRLRKETARDFTPIELGYALRYAIDLARRNRTGTTEMARALIEEGVDIDQLYAEWHPLCLAVFIENTDIVDAILSKRSEVNPIKQFGYACPPFIEAVRHGRVEMVKKLADAGASVDVNSHFTFPYNPLSQAAANGNLDMVQILLDLGCDLQATYDAGQGISVGTEALGAATLGFEPGSLTIASLLIQKGVSIHA